MPCSTVRLALLCMALLLASCSGAPFRSDGPGVSRIPKLPGDAIPRNEPRSRYGNGPIYEVLGRRYTVMDSGDGYKERGVASWYGKKFHGRLTSNREVYDMYAMTAAHKTLPLPTFVRVRNLRNNKSIVVRVNDRGPFVHNRIIDLSYSAAAKLDMITDGTSLVEVTAISPNTLSSRPAVSEKRQLPPESAADSTVASAPAINKIFVQVGAFGDHDNAARRLALLANQGVTDAFIHEELRGDTSLYRVRIGPVADVVQFDVLVEELENLGIMDPYLIAE